jgi:hypothetical protein
MRDYQIISPSLEGVLNHDALVYEGIPRPVELVRILDGAKIRRDEKVIDRELLEKYFQDLYSVFMKKVSEFAVASLNSSDETVRLQAMFQELVKVKRLLNM